MNALYPTVIAALLGFGYIYAQDPGTRVLTVNRTTDNIKIDGVAEEGVWTTALTSEKFFNKWPSDSGFADIQTEVKLLFNDQYLFVTAKCYQKRNDLVIQTLKRDQLESFWASDGFSIVLDPINQKANGFLFGVNAGGAQLEGAINLIGSWSRVNENWDNKWFSAVKVYDDYWVTEFAIPFSSLRFNDEATEWGLNFIRADMKRNVFSTWSRIPIQFNGTDLVHLGTLQFSEKIKPVRSRFTVIPYVSGGVSRNHEDREPTIAKGNGGLDMKVALNSSLNLDLTIRPDFSNVEVDRQMTNVTRYSLLFPERRNFFLENADLFANFGSWQARPFFSRRIGLSDGKPVPILAGARLSGNLSRTLRIGVMDVQTEITDELSANNYLVISAQKQLFGRSNFKLFAANRTTTKSIEADRTDNFNRTIGSEFQFVSRNGNWNAYLRGHTAQTPQEYAQRGYLSAQVNYQNKKLYTGLLAERVGENYVNDFGFIPRLYNYDAARDTTVRIGHQVINPWFGYLWYPKNSKLVNVIEPNTWSVITYRNTGEFLERNTSVNVSISFKDTRQLFLEAFSTSVNLPFASDIIDSGNPIPASRYSFTQYSIKYSTDSRKPINGDVSIGYGPFYNGYRVMYGATASIRRQPWGTFGISYAQNDIRLPEEYGEARFKLIGPRTEISLRRNIWWTTFLQYNTQQENFNINSRFQWRFKPMSDFFIVYSDNYATTDIRVKNRGIVFKITYWLNL